MYEMPRGTEELKLAGRIDLSDLSAIKRDKPTSETDFTFRIVTREISIKLDPGTRQRFQAWQEGLMSAVSVPSPHEQRRSIMKRASESESMHSPPPPPPVY